MSDALLPVIVTIAVGITLYFFNKGSRNRADIIKESLTELRMNMLYLLIGGAGLLASIICLLMPVLAEEYTREIFIVAGVMFLVFGSFSCLLLLWYRNHKVKFDTATLTVTDAYGKMRQLSWKDVKKVEFNSFSGLLTVSDRQGYKLKTHQHLVGFVALLQELLARASETHQFHCDELPLKSFGLQ